MDHEQGRDWGVAGAPGPDGQRPLLPSRKTRTTTVVATSGSVWCLHPTSGAEAVTDRREDLRRRPPGTRRFGYRAPPPGDRHRNVLTASRQQLDLRDHSAVNYGFKPTGPEFVYLAAGTVGGIHANASRPAEFIYDNLMIHTSVVHAAHVYDVKKLLDLGSSCWRTVRVPHDHYEDSGHKNVGTGEDLTIRLLATLVRDVVRPGTIMTFDTSKPGGMPRKLLMSRASTIWAGTVR
jgi:hypothetical protein